MDNFNNNQNGYAYEQQYQNTNQGGSAAKIAIICISAAVIVIAIVVSLIFILGNNGDSSSSVSSRKKGKSSYSQGMLGKKDEDETTSDEPESETKKHEQSAGEKTEEKTTRQTEPETGEATTQPVVNVSLARIAEENGYFPIKTHTLTKGDTVIYTDRSLSERGTEGRKSSTAYVNGNDDLYIYDIGKNSDGVDWIYFSFPVGESRYYAYAPLTAVTTSESDLSKYRVTGKAMTYLFSDGSGGSPEYCIEKGDFVYLVSISYKDSYSQILYPCKGGYRLAWVQNLDFFDYCVESY